MKKIVFFIVAACLFLCGCATAGKFTKISLGMTKAEVIRAIGKPTVVKATTLNKEGKKTEVLEYIEYKTGGDNLFDKPSYYLLYFVDGKLQKWEEEKD